MNATEVTALHATFCRHMNQQAGHRLWVVTIVVDPNGSNTHTRKEQS